MSRSLSLVFLSHMASSRAPTGAERSLAILAAGMKRRGHQVAVAAPGPWCLATELQAYGVEVETIPSRACWLAYHEPRAWPVAAAKWLRWAWPGKERAALAGFIQRRRADVVHVNCLPHLHGARAAAGRPTVWQVREILPPGRRRTWFARHLDRYALRIVAVSEAVASWLREEGLGGKTDLIRNGIAPVDEVPDRAAARRELNWPGEGTLFALLGQVVPHKGALEFVEAGRRVLRVCPDARFLIAGGGPDSFAAQVDEAIRRSGQRDRFRRLPPRSDPEILLDACDVVVVATRTPDPLPRAVLEGMAWGRPVIAFESGGVPEMVVHEKTGLLVPPGDVAGLAEAMARLGGDDRLRESMGEAGRMRAVSDFSLEAHLDRIESLFAALAG